MVNMITKNSIKSRIKVKALAQNIYMYVFKVRRVIDQLRRWSYEETLMILKLKPYQASLKLVYSVVANANDLGLNEADSFISKAKVNGVILLKRLRSRARGRSYQTK